MNELELFINIKNALEKQRLEFNYCGEFKVLLKKIKEELTRQKLNKLQQANYFRFLMETKDHYISDLYNLN